MGTAVERTYRGAVDDGIHGVCLFIILLSAFLTIGSLLLLLVVVGRTDEAHVGFTLELMPHTHQEVVRSYQV